MENSSLNAAHFCGRKAENHLKNLRFDESIDCHQQAVNNLEAALKSTSNVKILESLRLQIDYHLKMKELVRIKSRQYEKYQKAIQNQKLAQTVGIFKVNERFESSFEAQQEIFKTMDKLEEKLNKIKISSDPTKDDTTSLKSKESIEDLKSLNQQLHILIYNLVTHIDEAVLENTFLKTKISALESPQDKSPYDRLKDDRLNDIETDRGIEADESGLPPLDLPTFDISSFENKNEQ